MHFLDLCQAPLLRWERLNHNMNIENIGFRICRYMLQIPLHFQNPHIQGTSIF